MPTESGFATQTMVGRARHKTLQPVGSDRIGSPAPLVGLKSLKTGIVISTVTRLAADPRILVIAFTSVHSAKQGDILRMTSGGLIDWEFEIKAVTTTQIIHVWSVGKEDDAEKLPVAAETCQTLRWVTSIVGADGGLTVSPEVTPAALAPTKAFIDFSTATVAADAAAYTELVASVGANNIRKVQIFMSSGESLILAYGALGVESDKLILIPGGNGLIDLYIPSGTRLSVKRLQVGAIVNTGLLIINFLG